MRQVAAAGLPRFAELGEIQPGLRFAGSALKELGAVLREPRGLRSGDNIFCSKVVMDRCGRARSEVIARVARALGGGRISLPGRRRATVRTRGGINVEHACGAFYSVLGKRPLKRARRQCRSLRASGARGRPRPRRARRRLGRTFRRPFQPEPID